MRVYRFYKEYSSWYIDLPEYLQQGGTIGDLQMVEGADSMLDLIANGDAEVQLHISAQPFDNADELTLVEKCEPEVGGAYYRLLQFEGKSFGKQMWLCQVTDFVFGNIPDKIYIKRVSQKVN